MSYDSIRSLYYLKFIKDEIPSPVLTYFPAYLILFIGPSNCLIVPFLLLEFLFSRFPDVGASNSTVYPILLMELIFYTKVFEKKRRYKHYGGYFKVKACLRRHEGYLSIIIL